VELGFQLPFLLFEYLQLHRLPVGLYVVLLEHLPVPLNFWAIQLASLVLLNQLGYPSEEVLQIVGTARNVLTIREDLCELGV
jgi:hypothetical protein